MTTITTTLAAWSALEKAKEAITDQQDPLARMLESAASAFLKPRFTRTGQHPRIQEVTDNGKVEFEVTNGYDYGDDFYAVLTVDELITGKQLEAERTKLPS